MGFDEIKKLIDSKQINNLNRWPLASRYILQLHAVVVDIEKKF